MKRACPVLCFLAMLAASPAAAQDEWKYDLAIYGWLAGLDGTMGVGPLGQQPVKAGFDDLAGFVDFAMAGHFEARKAKGFFVTDLSYIGLSAERDAEVQKQTVQTVSIDMDLDQWIIEAGGGYRPTPELDILIVGRCYIFDLGGTFTSVTSLSTEKSQNWVDVFVGARYSNFLSEKWFFSVRGDIGAGGSQFAWFGNAAVAYQFTDIISAAIAYRVLSLDYEGGDDIAFIYDMTQSGLGIGLGFSF